MGLGKVFEPDRVFLIFLFLAGLAVIILHNTGVFPLSSSYAVFYLLLLILLGLYRPNFLWQGVVFFLPFELIVVATLPANVDLRAYQLGIVALLISTFLLWIQKKLILRTLRWFDLALALVLVGGTLTFFLNRLPAANSKDVFILYSFASFYYLGRLYLQKRRDVQAFIYTLLASGVAVAVYGIYQAIAFQKNWSDFMVMAGRPNSVFEEADWLGLFMGLVALAALVVTLQLKRWYQEFGGAVLFVLFLITLIITVSRSAWLGFGVAIVALAILLGYEYLSGFIHTRPKENRILIKFFLGVPVALILSLAIIFFFDLTRFQLGDRLTSTGTGDQVITIACTQGANPPASVENKDALGLYGCQHINLEEQEKFKGEGYIVREIEHPDPNIAIRQNLYQQTFAILKDHFFLGLGWGESVKAFGTDGRGAGLNSSNIFLEIWLGSGLIGLLGFLVFWLGIFFAILKRLYHKREMTEGFWLSILLLGFWLHATVFSLFNASLLLGIFIAVIMLFSWYGEKTAPKISNLWR